jgi:hypothetical protein
LEIGLQAAQAFDLVMMAPRRPARARTSADLLGVYAGLHLLWDFLVLLMGGLGAKLITPGLSPHRSPGFLFHLCRLMLLYILGNPLMDGFEICAKI